MGENARDAQEIPAKSLTPAKKFRPNEKLQAGLKNGINTCIRLAGSTVIVLMEITLVAGLGGVVGTYLSSKTIVEDCRRVSLAKVGDAYVRCTLVETAKDSNDKPPR